MTHRVLQVAATVFSLGVVASLIGRAWCLAMAAALTWWASASEAEQRE